MFHGFRRAAACAAGRPVLGGRARLAGPAGLSGARRSFGALAWWRNNYKLVRTTALAGGLLAGAAAVGLAVYGSKMPQHPILSSTLAIVEAGRTQFTGVPEWTSEAGESVVAQKPKEIEGGINQDYSADLTFQLERNGRKAVVTMAAVENGRFTSLTVDFPEALDSVDRTRVHPRVRYTCTNVDLQTHTPQPPAEQVVADTAAPGALADKSMGTAGGASDKAAAGSSGAGAKAGDSDGSGGGDAHAQARLGVERAARAAAGWFQKPTSIVPGPEPRAPDPGLFRFEAEPVPPSVYLPKNAASTSSASSSPEGSVFGFSPRALAFSALALFMLGWGGRFLYKRYWRPKVFRDLRLQLATHPRMYQHLGSSIQPDYQFDGIIDDRVVNVRMRVTGSEGSGKSAVKRKATFCIEGMRPAPKQPWLVTRVWLHPDSRKTAINLPKDEFSIHSE